ncbi:MAG TPA: hypothetical protein PKK95_10745 [Vicinamibacterales bacterium]|nr:hypothetical protein [Vicinamibacterales bacterium]
MTTSRDPLDTAAYLVFALAVLFAAASVGNIVLPAAYARETASWAAQGLGQDWVDVLVVVPVLLLSALLARRGSRRAALVMGGATAYTTYSLVLYAFAVHFNQLFLVYGVALGAGFYALVNLVVSYSRGDRRSWLSPGRLASRAAGAFAVFLGLAFYTLWLAEIIPAIAAGRAPETLAEVGLITNPVQVLDVGIVLPAFVVGGVALLRGRRLGYWLVPVMLTFAVLMDLALIGMDVSMATRNVPGGGQRILMFAVMAAVSLGLCWGMLRSGAREN